MLHKYILNVMYELSVVIVNLSWLAICYYLIKQEWPEMLFLLAMGALITAAQAARENAHLRIEVREMRKIFHDHYEKYGKGESK